MHGGLSKCWLDALELNIHLNSLVCMTIEYDDFLMQIDDISKRKSLVYHCIKSVKLPKAFENIER